MNSQTEFDGVAAADLAAHLAGQLATIEALPLGQRADALSLIYDQVRTELETADTNVAPEQS